MEFLCITLAKLLDCSQLLLTESSTFLPAELCSKVKRISLGIEIFTNYITLVKNFSVFKKKMALENGNSNLSFSKVEFLKLKIQSIICQSISSRYIEEIFFIKYAQNLFRSKAIISSTIIFPTSSTYHFINHSSLAYY